MKNLNVRGLLLASEEGECAHFFPNKDNLSR